MKILIAEDDLVSRQLLESKLVKWGYEVVAARDGDEAIKALHDKDAPRLAVLDWMMPVVDGVEVCRRLRKENREPYTYIILLTAFQREEDLVAGMEAGADDYISKPFKTNELKIRLRAGRRIIELQDELIAARELFKAKASHDPLTGLLNHEEILRVLTQEMARSERGGGNVVVIMADLDHFKVINDTYGQMAGDAVLSIVARRMLAVVRPFDSIGRYGGEEFMAVLPGCDEKASPTLAERLRACVGDDLIDTPEGMIPITISIGVASSRGRPKTEMEALVNAAVEALYRAKVNGRDRVEVAPSLEAVAAVPR